jgi:ApbE superfamily uncharacterized protein (UPF0280 family)
MTRSPQITWLADGKRLHLQDGPIDLIIEANGTPDNVRTAYANAAARFDGLLDELCAELQLLRAQADPVSSKLQGTTARRMHDAVAPFAGDHFITPMAAVAGAVAEEILEAMTLAATLDRAYVNNGGDIALHLTAGQSFSVGLIDRPDRPSLIGKTIVRSEDATRGIATSGRHGRSFSLGIADAVTVLAKTAAQADAAATIIGNAVDLPGHAAIARVPANDIQPDSDLGDRLVTRSVGFLSQDEIMQALAAGADCARELMQRGLIEGAALTLQGQIEMIRTEIVRPVTLPDTVQLLAPAA